MKKYFQNITILNDFLKEIQEYLTLTFVIFYPYINKYHKDCIKQQFQKILKKDYNISCYKKINVILIDKAFDKGMENWKPQPFISLFNTSSVQKEEPLILKFSNDATITKRSKMSSCLDYHKKKYAKDYKSIKNDLMNYLQGLQNEFKFCFYTVGMESIYYNEQWNDPNAIDKLDNLIISSFTGENYYKVLKPFKMDLSLNLSLNLSLKRYTTIKDKNKNIKKVSIFGDNLFRERCVTIKDKNRNIKKVSIFGDSLFGKDIIGKNTKLFVIKK